MEQKSEAATIAKVGPAGGRQPPQMPPCAARAADRRRAPHQKVLFTKLSEALAMLTFVELAGDKLPFTAAKLYSALNKVISGGESPAEAKTPVKALAKLLGVDGGDDDDDGVPRPVADFVRRQIETLQLGGDVLKARRSLSPPTPLVAQSARRLATGLRCLGAWPPAPCPADALAGRRGRACSRSASSSTASGGPAPAAGQRASAPLGRGRAAHARWQSRAQAVGGS